MNEYKIEENYPTSETICVICGKRIIYNIFKDKSQKIKNKVPKAHKGRCSSFLWENSIKELAQSFKKKKKEGSE